MVHHVYTVVARNGGWAVEHRGKVLEVYKTPQEAEAACDRLARLTQVSGHDAEVVVKGETGEVDADRVYRRFDR
jgi:hypothetical protein